MVTVIPHNRKKSDPPQDTRYALDWSLARAKARYLLENDKGLRSVELIEETTGREEKWRMVKGSLEKYGAKEVR